MSGAARSGAVPGSAAAAGLFGRDVQSLAPVLQRSLMLQEPARLARLLQLMLGGYGLAGAAYATPVEVAARTQMQDIAKQQAKNQALSGIPVVGKLLGGLNL